MDKTLTEKIVKQAEEIAKECASRFNYQILDCEYVKEFGVYILRIIADSPNGLSIDEATELNEAISAELDKYDFIEDEYYLEVSSPGLERPLKTEEDIISAVGEYINIKLYEKIENQKELNGDLLDYTDGILTLKVNIKGINKTLKIERKKISKLRLAVKF